MQLNEFLMPEFKEEMASTCRMLAAFDSKINNMYLSIKHTANKQ